MPTIGKATIDVDYDGDDLPRQARQIGKEAGEAQSEAAAKELKKGAKDTNADLGREAEKAGDEHGNKYGVKFSDSRDKVIKGRTQKLSDQVAGIFADDKSLDAYIRKLDDAGKGFDSLGADLDDLHDKHVLTDTDYQNLTSQLQENVSALGDEKRALADHVGALDEARAAADRTREANGKLARERLEGFWADQQEAARRFQGDLDRHVTPSIDLTADRVENLGAKVEESSTRVERNRRPFGRLGDTFRDIGRTLGDGAESLGDKILSVGRGSEDGGKKAGAAAPGFGKLFHAFSNFDPGDNIGQLILLIVAFAPQLAVLASAAAGGLLILAGAATALGLAAIGGYIGFSNLFGDIKKIPKDMQEPARALQDFVGGFKDLRLTLQQKMFAGLQDELNGLSTSLLPTLKGVFGILGTALNSVLNGILKDLNSSGFKKDLTALFSGAAPVIKDLGETFRITMGIVGSLITSVLPSTHEFTGGLNDMLGAFLALLKSPEGKRQVQDWLNDAKDVLGKVGTAIGEVAGALGDLVTPEHIDETIATVKSLGEAGIALAKLGDELSPAVPVVVAAISTLAGAFQAAATITDPLVTGAQIGVFHFLQFFNGLANVVGGIMSAVATSFSGTAQAIAQAATGDFAGAAATIASTMASVKTSTETAMGGVARATGNAAGTFDALDSKTQGVLSGLASRLGLTGDDAKTFGGRVYDAANIGGVSLSDLAKSKSLDQVGSKLGITGAAADYLLGDFQKASSGSITAVSDLSRQSQSYLSTISSNMGATGKAGDVLQLAIARSTGGSKTALKGLADDKNLDTFIANMTKGGGASKTEFANKIVAAASDAGVSIDALPPKIQALISKYGGIPDKKTTKLYADDQTAGAVASARAAIESLHDKTIRIQARYSSSGSIGQGSTQNAFGGIIAGGKQLAGGQPFKAFAKGGLINRPTLFGSALAGEAGPEAIVPLTGALGSVDRSVRDLAAFARGRKTGYSGPSTGTKQVNVQPGAIVVRSSSADGGQVASAVLDRLGIAVGAV